MFGRAARGTKASAGVRVRPVRTPPCRVIVEAAPRRSRTRRSRAGKCVLELTVRGVRSVSPRRARRRLSSLRPACRRHRESRGRRSVQSAQVGGARGVRGAGGGRRIFRARPSSRKRRARGMSRQRKSLPRAGLYPRSRASSRSVPRRASWRARGPTGARAKRASPEISARRTSLKGCVCVLDGALGILKQVGEILPYGSGLFQSPDLPPVFSSS
jgi:hypothetical protein